MMLERAAVRPAGLGAIAGVVLLSTLLCGCVVHRSESHRSLGGSANNYGEPTVIPNCELGQAVAEKGCRDIVLRDESGQETNLREAFASSRCRAVHDRLKAANHRTQAYLRVPGHDLRAGLTRIQAECELREEHIEACRLAGFFGSPGGGARLEGYLEGQDACDELAELYRRRLANGYRSAP